MRRSPQRAAISRASKPLYLSTPLARGICHHARWSFASIARAGNLKPLTTIVLRYRRPEERPCEATLGLPFRAAVIPLL